MRISFFASFDSLSDTRRPVVPFKPRMNLVSRTPFGQIRTFQGPHETKDPDISRIHLVLNDVHLLCLVLIPLV